MGILTNLFGAAARLFGPPPRVDEDGRPGKIDGAGVSAALIALGAKMAKADGSVSPNEVAAFKRVFQASQQDEARIGHFFDLARQTPLGYDRYARIVARKFRAQPAALEDVLDGLFHIAMADSVITDEENAFLHTVARIFGFSEREFMRVKTAHTGEPTDDPYLMLGVDEDISDANLKRAYRRMAAANHPDRLMARGLPPEMQKLANHKMAMINRAYQEILDIRKRERPLELTDLS